MSEDDEDRSEFAATEAKLQEMRDHANALVHVGEIARGALGQLWQIAEPLGEAALRALVQGLINELAAEAKARLG